MSKVENLSMMDDWDEHLAHYGVKGMKWGVRKDRLGGGGLMGKYKRKKIQERQDFVKKYGNQAYGRRAVNALPQVKVAKATVKGAKKVGKAAAKGAGKLNQARLKRADRMLKQEKAWADHIRSQKTFGKKVKTFLTGELPSSQRGKTGKISINVFEDDPPKVKAGKLATQAAIGVLVGMTLVELNK